MYSWSGWGLGSPCWWTYIAIFTLLVVELVGAADGSERWGGGATARVVLLFIYCKE